MCGGGGLRKAQYSPAISLSPASSAFWPSRAGSPLRGGSVTKAPASASAFHQPAAFWPVTKAPLLTTVSIVHRRRGLWRLTYLGVQESLFTDRIFDLFDADRNGSDRSRACCTPSMVWCLFGCFKFQKLLSKIALMISGFCAKNIFFTGGKQHTFFCACISAIQMHAMHKICSHLHKTNIKSPERTRPLL